MKRHMLPLLAALFLISPFSHAADTQQALPDEKTFQDYMSKMQAHMKTMQDQMQQMQKTTDPKERQRLMQDHWAAMQEGMKMMHGTGNMAGCTMMGGGPMMSHMMDGHMGMMDNHMGMMGNDNCCGGDGHMMGSWWDNKNLSKDDINQRMQMMGACMGMQQQMMDQMMIYQNSTSAGDAKKP